VMAYGVVSLKLFYCFTRMCCWESAPGSVCLDCRWIVPCCVSLFFCVFLFPRCCLFSGCLCRFIYRERALASKGEISVFRVCWRGAE